MRKITEPQAHRARAALVEGAYPEDMKARCAACGKVGAVSEGSLMRARKQTPGATGFFVCGGCADKVGAAA